MNVVSINSREITDEQRLKREKERQSRLTGLKVCSITLNTAIERTSHCRDSSPEVEPFIEKMKDLRQQVLAAIDEMPKPDTQFIESKREPYVFRHLE